MEGCTWGYALPWLLPISPASSSCQVRCEEQSRHTQAHEAYLPWTELSETMNQNKIFLLKVNSVFGHSSENDN